jgi:hypothetical protein
MSEDLLIRADEYREKARATVDVDNQALLLFIADGLQALAHPGDSAVVAPEFLRPAREPHQKMLGGSGVRSADPAAPSPDVVVPYTSRSSGGPIWK